MLNKKADFLTQRSSSPEHECLPAEPAARKKRPQLKAELYAHSPYQQFFLNFLYLDMEPQMSPLRIVVSRVHGQTFHIYVCYTYPQHTDLQIFTLKT